VIYQHPLAYLLGLQGVALLRAYNGEYDREFTEARIAEIRAMLDCASDWHESGLTWRYLVVELRGLEPLTPCLQSRCSSS
jgi:hypothetical protein